MAREGESHLPHRGRRAGHVCKGAPQEPRRPCRLRAKSRVGHRVNKGQDPGRRARPRRGAKSEPSAVRPSEGNEVRPDGRQGVGALRSTGEAGELAPEDPVDGKAVPDQEILEGNDGRDPEPETISSKLQRVAVLVQEP